MFKSHIFASKRNFQERKTKHWVNAPISFFLQSRLLLFLYVGSLPFFPASIFKATLYWYESVETVWSHRQPRLNKSFEKKRKQTKRQFLHFPFIIVCLCVGVYASFTSPRTVSQRSRRDKKRTNKGERCIFDGTVVYLCCA